MEQFEYENNAIKKFGQSIHDGKWSNEGLVKLIELAGDFLNIKTIPRYAKANGLSYPGVAKTRNIRIIFDVKFVIDNS